jgi:hypothetical protein
VAISLIVKAEKTHTKNTSSVIRGIEKYTSRVFLLLLLCTFALALVDVLSYYVGLQGIATPIVGFFLFAAVFYAPVAIVIDNKGLLSAVKRSVRHVVSEPKYFLLWVVLVVAVLTVLDFIAIHTLGTLLSRYALLLVNSLFVLPYFIIYQAEAYMRRFPVLKH